MVSDVVRFCLIPVRFCQILSGGVRCEHKPSMTCYYRDNEFLEVGQWLYNKFDKISGISFLPYSEHTYQQAPYEPIDLETFEKLKEEFPETIDWNISESADMTEGSQQLACTGNNCEL